MAGKFGEGGFKFGSGSSQMQVITGSGHKRRRGSVQPSSSRAGKKPKQDIDRDYREKKKVILGS
ncbi:hypothetical protein NC652_041658 [Populus alba x Populus x berolinensis]|nr:hypothetical protein NC652_041658 [Populus alba x Populus x berolinensis]